MMDRKSSKFGQTRRPEPYRFGGSDSYRSGSGDSYRPDERRNFSFRASSHHFNPLQHPPPDLNRRSHPLPPRPGNRSRERPRPNDRHRGARAKPQARKQWKPPPTSSRPLLQNQREQTPEQLQGMNDGSVRFKALNDLSDSDEEPMEIESDAEEKDKDARAVAEPPPSKRQAIQQTQSRSDDGNSVPKWSNPDPYTVLPASGELQLKKKDVVQLIRKAKADLRTESVVANHNDDFISLDFGDDTVAGVDDAASQRSSDHRSAPVVGEGMPNAPTGPSAMKGGPPVSNKAGVVRFELHKPPPRPPPIADESLQAQLQDQRDAESQHHLASFATSASTDKSGKKRKFNDEDDTTRKRKRAPKPEKGEVTPDWKPRHNTNDLSRTPWLVSDYSDVLDVSLRLHKEICDFYEYVRPTEFENAVRQDLVTRLSNFVSRRFDGAEIHYFGSFAAGLYLPDGDMDLVMVSQDYLQRGFKRFGQSKSAIRRVADALRSARICRAGSLATIGGAKVPIIKYVDDRTGIRVDISFENDTGLIANSTYLRWKEQYPAMPVLVALVKQFLLMRDLNEVHTGGIGGFTVTCLVVSCMQHMPQVLSGAMDPMQHLGEVFMEFLNLYGNRFDTTKTGIQMEPPMYIPKKSWFQGLGLNIKKPGNLCIIDPNKPDNDISAGSGHVLTIFKRFSLALETLQQAMTRLQTCEPHQRNGSILASLYEGNYEIYEYRRAHLKRLHSVVHG